MTGKTLAEKQMYYFNAHKCPYCDGYTDLVDSAEVYQQSHGLIYICRPCQAWVGVHEGSDQALGCLAKKTLRDLRHQAHLLFDPLWQKKQRQTGLSTKSVRGKAYKWLAGLLGITPEEAHIGYCDMDQCKIIIEECKKFYPSAEEIEEKKKLINQRIESVYSLSGVLGFDVKKYEMNALLQLELSKGSIVYKYRPIENVGAWGDEKRFSTIDNLNEHFQKIFK